MIGNNLILGYLHSSRVLGWQLLRFLCDKDWRIDVRCLMAADEIITRALFGVAVSSSFPLRFQDLSNIQEVPNHQEIFVDPSRDESIIIELLDFKHDVEDHGSAVWFLRDLASEQDAEQSMLLEQSGIVEAVGLRYRDVPSVVSTAVGQMAVSKGRQGREAQNIVRVYLANLRLKGASTDVLITAYEPVFINPLSTSARSVGAGPAVPAADSGCLPMAEVFKHAVTSFTVHDWSLFGAVS
ncbi:probable ran guanine nucleotide release factor isoform X2 [Phalaenopsis equestris]|uniref:probable ran guanine nucleotide release factor isoform X2 n=1 Tax=Phalaenopsis equestris TaxID=78828 RepID=UPI0009E48622|nr:probable ran guanine nucleotide release factor isoform X2 [Phalaenopsis equestris]